MDAQLLCRKRGRCRPSLANLVTLPDDLLRHLFQFIQYTGDISLCCKRLCTIANTAFVGIKWNDNLMSDETAPPRLDGLEIRDGDHWPEWDCWRRYPMLQVFRSMRYTAMPTHVIQYLHQETLGLLELKCAVTYDGWLELQHFTRLCILVDMECQTCITRICYLAGIHTLELSGRWHSDCADLALIEQDPFGELNSGRWTSTAASFPVMPDLLNMKFRSLPEAMALRAIGKSCRALQTVTLTLESRCTSACCGKAEWNAECDRWDYCKPPVTSELCRSVLVTLADAQLFPCLRSVLLRLPRGTFPTAAKMLVDVASACQWRVADRDVVTVVKFKRGASPEPPLRWREWPSS